MEPNNSILPLVVLIVNWGILFINAVSFTRLIYAYYRYPVLDDTKVNVGLLSASVLAIFGVNVASAITHYLVYFYYNEQLPYPTLWTRFIDRWFMVMFVIAMDVRLYLYIPRMFKTK